MNNLIKSLLAMLLLALGVSQTLAEQKVTFYHYDLLGSPVATTDENGDVIWREEYSPWGEKLLKEDEALDNVRGYTGHVNDKETGLTYMQARYYDPQIGRFMGVDPVGFQENNPISFNRYNYANNNPYKFTDPNGETPLGDELDQLNEMEAQDNAEKEAWADLLSDPEKQKEYIDNRIKNNIIGGILTAVGFKFGKVDISNSKALMLKQNNAVGTAFENKVFYDLQKTQSNVVTQITVKTKTGVRTRIDILGKDSQGNIVCTECKSSHTAPLTTNQAAAFPEIQQSGATIVGKGKIGFPGGTVIPPTTVNIVRP